MPIILSYYRIIFYLFIYFIFSVVGSYGFLLGYPVCFCVLKALLKKIDFYFIFY